MGNAMNLYDNVMDCCYVVERKYELLRLALLPSRFIVTHFMMCLAEKEFLFIIINKLNNFIQYDLLQSLENIMINRYGYFSYLSAKLFIVMCELNIKDFLVVFDKHFKEYGFLTQKMYACDNLFLFFKSNYFNDLKNNSVRFYDKYQIKIGPYLLSCNLFRFSKEPLYLYRFSDEFYLFTGNGKPAILPDYWTEQQLRISFYLTFIDEQEQLLFGDTVGQSIT